MIMGSNIKTKIFLFLAAATLALGSVSKADDNDHFVEHLYAEQPWQIWLYLCEQANRCLGTKSGWGEDGWSAYSNKKTDPTKYECFFNGDEDGHGDPNLTVDKGQVEKLITVLSKCRASHVKILEETR